MKGFNSSRRLFYAEIITVKPNTGFPLNAVLHIHPLTFINEALHLSGSPFVASRQAFMTCCVNMATPIHSIDGKCHIK